MFEISKNIQNFDQKYISGYVLVCTQNCHLKFNSTHCAPPPTHTHIVCWIEVKVAVLHAWHYMLWNLLRINVLNISWYFKHQIPTRIWSEATLKQNWRKCLRKKQQIAISEDNYFNNVSSMLLSKSYSIFKMWCFKYQIWFNIRL